MPTGTPPYADTIDSAITDHRVVYVAYDGGSTPGRVRTLQPKSWLTEWVSFRAIEHGALNPQEKTYRVDRISRCLSDILGMNVNTSDCLNKGVAASSKKAALVYV